MATRRLTREESRAITCERLLEAAADAFSEKGFHGASVEEIVARAGYTRGAFYSNFSDKDDLFLALIDRRYARDVNEVTEIIRNSDSSQALIAALRERSQRVGIDVPWLLLFREFQLYAIRNPRVRPQLAARLGAERDALGQVFVQQFEAAGLEPPAPPALAGLLLQLIDRGSTIEHVIDPDGVPVDAYFDMLAYVSEAGLALATRTVNAGSRQSGTNEPTKRRRR